MPAKKNRGIISVQNKRFYNGMEVKPVKYFNGKSGKGLMAGSVNGELIVVENGKVRPFRSI